MPSLLSKVKGSDGPSPAVSRLIYSAKILIAAGAFTCLFYFSDTRTLGVALQSADYWLVAAGSAIFLCGQYLAAQRWRGVLGSGSVTVSRFEVLRLNLVGTFFGNFLPGQGSGDLVKSALLFGRFPNRRPFLLASVVYDRLLGLSAMLSLALVGVLMLGLVNGDWSLVDMVGWVLVFFACLLTAVKYLHHLPRLRRVVGGRLGKRIRSFSEQLVELFRNRPLFLRSFALSMVFQLTWTLSLWMMLRAIQPAAPLIPVLLAAPMAVLVASVPVSLGGLGVREGAFSLLMQRFGMDAHVATAGALLSLVPLLIASSVGAGLTLSMRRRQGSCTSSI